MHKMLKKSYDLLTVRMLAEQMNTVRLNPFLLPKNAIATHTPKYYAEDYEKE